MIEGLPAPGRQQHFAQLIEPRLSVLVPYAVALVLVDVEQSAAPQSDNQPAPTEVVEQRKLLGKPHRMIERALDDCEADGETGRCRGKRRSKGHRIDVGT